MKTIKLLSLLMILGLFLSSCEKDDPVFVPAETLKFTNLHAPADVRDHQTGEIIEANEFVYFDISKGSVVAKTDDWDLGFKGTIISVNSGISGSGNVSAALLNNTFAEVTEAPDESLFNQDTDISMAIPGGSGNGWYTYNPANHLISPIPGRIIIVKTTEGNYAKIEILSYYKDAPSNPDPTAPGTDAFFTFNYAYQPDGSKKF